MKITERSKRRSPMPGMAISSWPSRNLASRGAHGPNMVRLPVEYKRARRPRPGSPHCDCIVPRIARLSSAPTRIRISCMRLASLPPSPPAPRPPCRRAAAERPRDAAGGQAAVGTLDGWRQPDGSRLAAVEIRLAPGWHTYWRVPGDAGIPPSFDWSGSSNLASVAYEWPRPEIFDSFGMRTHRL